MWKEAERFRVCDEDGTTHIVVKMSNVETGYSWPRAGSSEVSFYFLLDSSDVKALANGTFLHQKTGTILTRVRHDG